MVASVAAVVNNDASKQNTPAERAQPDDKVAHSVLVVEDNHDTADLLCKIIQRAGFEATACYSIEGAKKSLDNQVPSIALVDLGLPDGGGVSLIETLAKNNVEHIIVVTGSQDINTTLSCLRAGVFDYLQKPVSAQDLVSAIRRITRAENRQKIHYFDEMFDVPSRVIGLNSDSKESCVLRSSIKSAATSKFLHTLITGEPGVLKPEIASLVHKHSCHDAPLIYINCGVENDSLASTRFFGKISDEHESASTNEENGEGYLKKAGKGSLLLDDLSHLPKFIQAALLDFLKHGHYRPDGSLSIEKSNARVLAVLREPSEDAFNSGRLLPELYYLLARNEIAVPPLRQRGKDIGTLIDVAVAEMNQLFGTEKSVSPDLKSLLENHSWPGNFIEFKNVLLTSYSATEDGEEMVMNARVLPNLQSGVDSTINNFVGDSFWDIERKLMFATLESVNGNKQKAAKLLGVSLKTLYNRLKALE